MPTLRHPWHALESCQGLQVVKLQVGLKCDLSVSYTFWQTLLNICEKKPDSVGFRMQEDCHPSPLELKQVGSQNQGVPPAAADPPATSLVTKYQIQVVNQPMETSTRNSSLDDMPKRSTFSIFQ